MDIIFGRKKKFFFSNKKFEFFIFSWDCLQEGHEPASCENWKDWFDKIAEIKPEECKYKILKYKKKQSFFFVFVFSKRNR
jgi:hypothetical protein